MTVQLIQVDWTGKDLEGATVGFTFDDVEKVNIKKDSDVKASRATITLKNPYDRFRSGFDQPFSKYVDNTNEIRFREGDTVKIYGAQIDSFRELDTSSGSPDLLMSGEIAEVGVNGKKDSAKITLQIVDKTYVILNRVHTFPYAANQNLNAPEIIQKVVRSVTDNVESDPLSYDNSGNFVSNGIYSVDARLVTAGGFIQDTRQNGSAFPNTSMVKVAKPAYTWVKDLSSTESTNNFDGRDSGLPTDLVEAPVQDRNMLFYFDEVVKLHWFYPLDVKTTTLDGAINDSVTTISLTDASSFPSIGTVFIGSERIDYTGKSTNDLTGCTRGANNTLAASHADLDTVKNAIVIVEGDTSSGFTLENYRLKKKTFDIVNFVIFNCGADMEGNGITFFYFDKASRSKTLKDTFKAYNDIASELMQKEIIDGRLTKDNTVTSAFTFNGNRYKETTGNYNGGAGVTTSWGVSVTSNSTYNDSFRTECNQQGTMRAMALTARKGSPRWKGTMNFKFARFTAGEVFEFTSTRAGINQQALRIKTSIYNLTKTGMFASLMVEEDEERLAP